MPNVTNGDEKLFLTSEEVRVVDNFRRSRDTNVLTIMFTDIKGFTKMTEERGEAFSQDVRKKHDGIMRSAIESGGAGMIIKHIGDSVMAVFTEPSKAVEAAMAVQREIAASKIGVEIRIGLDMGQVTFENEVNPDVFGRHVNRASRVEGLAGGGQIFMTFSVFDSAKGFLTSDGGKKASWRSHGKYYLKGIGDAVEIFEVASEEKTIRPPAAGTKKSEISYFWLSTVAVVFVLSAALYILRPSLTSVTFVGVSGDNVFLDFRTKLLLDGGLNDRTRRSLTPIAPGRHRIWFDRSYCVRYYSDEFTVSMGHNNVEPKVEYYSIPSMDSSLSFSRDATSEARFSESKSFAYSLFDENNAKSDNALTVEVELAASPAAGKKIVVTGRMTLTLNGNVAAKFERSDDAPAGDGEKLVADEYVFRDAKHAFKVKFRSYAERADIVLGSYYNGYF